MDPRISLLQEFSRGFIPGTAKVETEQYGFPFLDRLLSDGASLEYGELTATRLLHKYKLVNLSARRMDELLQLHITKECNVCRYFDASANNVFCFNLDNNHKTNNTAVIPEITLALRGLRDCLVDRGLMPLIVASGRGYHVWCRLNEPVDNNRLYQFMLRAAVHALLPFHGRGYDHKAVKFNFYPDIKAHNVVSLRLFGSDHAKNKVFSRVLTPDRLLGEAASWDYFGDFLRNKAIPSAKFTAAFNALPALL
jgi:hypothetical protein